uniref:Uncharacterized protein n=1 Tax=Globisporangium ultimum (strain ATCC 200006 / CBS 805.95 / DAOM BR144) TaxID=431595 RepID=K3WL16_GLOUD
MDYVLPQYWSIPCACEHGHGVELLERLAAHEVVREIDPFYNAFLFRQAVANAMKADNLEH